MSHGTIRSYYTPAEVGSHNCAEDCWVSIFNTVYDLSSFLSENRGQLAQPIIQHAGEDLSHWFNPETKDVKTHIDPKRNITLPYLPYGPFLHAPSPDPSSNLEVNPPVVWWKNKQFCIGKLSKKTRKVEIVNVLTEQTKILQVCSEETINEIQNRYMEWNAHATSYTWKHLEDDEFVPMNMTLTLAENGIPDESATMENLNIDEEQHLPILHVYYNDDLTIA